MTMLFLWDLFLHSEINEISWKTHEVNAQSDLFSLFCNSSCKVIKDLTKLMSVLIVVKLYHSSTSTDMWSLVEGMSMDQGSSVISAEKLPRLLVDWRSTGSSSMKLQVWRMLPCTNVVIVHINPRRSTTGTSMRGSTARKERDRCKALSMFLQKMRLLSCMESWIAPRQLLTPCWTSLV